MIAPASFYQALRRQGLTYFTGVPDSLLKGLCDFINDRVPAVDHVINANEGSAIALAAGYHLATGRAPVVYLQNSGTGNAINPLLSLADPAVYAIPMLLLIGWRGEPGVSDEPQHVAQGRVTEPLLGAIEMPYAVVDGDTDDYEGVVRLAASRMRTQSRPYAILVRTGTFAPYAPKPMPARDRPLTRAGALEILLGALDARTAVVSTTGYTSREVYAYRERKGQGHELDFLTVGSMGHCSQIALGLAQHMPSRLVVCLDGDGAVVMHMGSLAIIGSQSPSNLRHVVLNNGAHDSVGGQPTAADRIDLPAVALACGYRSARVASTEADLAEAIGKLGAEPGPSLLEVRIRSEARTDAGRPTTTPIENKLAFMKAVRADVH